jgi:4-hydroxy-tetrahydrodipicolinate reductase
MRKKTVKVAIWGFGAMGSGMAKMILNKTGFEIVGVCDLYPGYENKSIFEILKVDNPYKEDILVTNNIDDILKIADVDVILLATDSFTKGAFPKIKRIIEAGINVISTAEEMAFPKANEPELAKEINELAKKHQVSVLGTGVNPGMMMDLLAVCISGINEDIKSFEISRINSLSPFGKTVMEEQGVGLSVNEFNERLKNDEIAGHVGFKESAYMIAEALGLEVKQFSQSMKPIITDFDRKSPYGFAKKGDVCGVEMSAEVVLDNDITIKLYHPQQIEPELAGVSTGDYIKIEGKPAINLANSPEVEGGIGTIAICVNMIPLVINSTPGLKTMLDLPVPRAIMGDVRKLIKED